MISPWRVPTTVTVGEVVASPAEPVPANAFASPKSRSFTCPSGVTATFDGLRSRWMIPFSCAPSSASATCRKIGSASATGRGPRDVRSASVPPGTSSRTRACCPADSSSPWIEAMFGWFKAARTRASRWRRETHSGSREKPSGSTLSATSRPSFRSFARYTSPIPPAPSGARTS